MRKYRKNYKISSMSAINVIRDEFLYIGHKIYHHGWWKSMPYRTIEKFVARGLVFSAMDNFMGFYYDTRGDGEIVEVLEKSFLWSSDIEPAYGLLDDYGRSFVMKSKLKELIKSGDYLPLEAK